MGKLGKCWIAISPEAWTLDDNTIEDREHALSLFLTECEDQDQLVRIIRGTNVADWMREKSVIYVDKASAEKDAQKRFEKALKRLPPDTQERFKQASSPAARVAERFAKARTFDEAKREIMDYLKSKHWTLSPPLKIPHATSPDKELRVWFKSQAVYLSQDSRGSHSLKGARSLHVDIRRMTPEQFLQQVERWRD